MTCHHNTSTAMGFTVEKHYWTDTGSSTTGGYMKTSNDLSVTYTDWTSLVFVKVYLN